MEPSGRPPRPRVWQGHLSWRGQSVGRAAPLALRASLAEGCAQLSAASQGEARSLSPSCLLSVSSSSSHISPEHPTVQAPQGHGHPWDPEARAGSDLGETSGLSSRRQEPVGGLASEGPVIQCGRLPIRLLHGPRQGVPGAQPAPVCPAHHPKRPLHSLSRNPATSAGSGWHPQAQTCLAVDTPAYPGEPREKQ